VFHCLNGKFVVTTQGALLIAAADDLKEQVGRVGIVAEVSNFVDGD